MTTSADLMRKYTDIINEIAGPAGHPSEHTPPGPQPHDNVRPTNPVTTQASNSDRPGGSLPPGRLATMQDKMLPNGNYRLGGKAVSLLRNATTPPVKTTTSQNGEVGPKQKAIWDAVRMDKQYPSTTPQEKAYHIAVNKLWNENHSTSV